MKRDIFSCFGRVLVLAPHTDDEFGCAGTLHRLLASGAEVRYVAFSRCEASVPAGFAVDTLERECRSCLHTLGVAATHVDIRGFAVRHFPEHRQEILEEMVKLNREYAPDLVLLPSSADLHQDHATIANEGFRAFKHCTILAYELPQNLISFENSAFVELSEEDMEKKIEALRCYRSQAFRKYSAEQFIRGLATVRGVQANVTFAESFEVVRLVASRVEVLERPRA